MSRTSPVRLAIVLVALGIFVSGSFADTSSELLHNMQGKWKSTSLAGDVPPGIKQDGLTVIISGNKITISDGQTTDSAAFKVDGSKSPAWLDISLGSGAATVSGLVQCDGHELKMVWEQGGHRPTSFDPTKTNMVIVLRNGPAATQATTASLPTTKPG
jgi:uncharacterized protein (TIGR03067 family)